MKWFRHYTTARMGNSLGELMELIGPHFGYAAYFKLVEYCSAKYEGSNTLFVIRIRVLRDLLETSTQSLTKFMDNSTAVGLFRATKHGQLYSIEFPKIAEIKDEYTRKSGVPKKKTPDTVAQEQNRTEQNRKNKKKAGKPACPFISDVMDHFNTTANKSFKKNSQKTISLLNARYCEGFTKLSDYLEMLDYKISEWKDSEDDKYLRPETLFGNKFESYVESAKTKNRAEDKFINALLGK